MTDTASTRLAAQAMRLGVRAFILETASIDRDARISELTQDEIESLVHAVLATAALQSPPAQDRNAVLEEAFNAARGSNADMCSSSSEAYRTMLTAIRSLRTPEAPADIRRAYLDDLRGRMTKGDRQCVAVEAPAQAEGGE